MNNHRQFGVLSLSAILAAAAAAAVGGSSSARSHPGEIVGIHASHCSAWSFHRVGNEQTAYAAVVRRRLRAYRQPAHRPFARFGRTNANDVPTVFGIRAAVVNKRCAPLWYRVQLPMRPNGVTGYVRASKVHVGRVHTRIVVDISARRLTFFRWGRPLLRTTVAVGSPATPTPRGFFYVNQRLIPSDRSGPFGPAAIGVSAFSPVLTGWTQGGPIAVHGTNEPWSIGRAVSNGCIRARNRVVGWLFKHTLAGTPVLIHE